MAARWLTRLFTWPSMRGKSPSSSGCLARNGEGPGVSWSTRSDKAPVNQARLVQAGKPVQLLGHHFVMLECAHEPDPFGHAEREEHRCTAQKIESL